MLAAIQSQYGKLYDLKRKGITGTENPMLKLFQAMVAMGQHDPTGGQGLTYIHPEGAEPIILTSLHTRILMPDGELAVLGDDNSVFLTITKTPQQPIIPKENTSKKIKDKYKKP